MYYGIGGLVVVIVVLFLLFRWARHWLTASRPRTRRCQPDSRYLGCRTNEYRKV